MQHPITQPQHATVSRENNLRDLLAAYDLLAGRRHVDPEWIAVVGSSYGGYLASILTSMRPVKWLALRVPALYIVSEWELPKLQLHKDQDLNRYRHSFVPAEDNRALRAYQAFEGDELLVESEHDDRVPRPVLKSYREACTHARSLTYRRIAGADHGLTREVDQRAYTSLLVKWLSEMIFGARAGKTGPDTQMAHPATLPETTPDAMPEVG
jgi:pimeloyl-ACP methyl ester carboxylesterase